MSILTFLTCLFLVHIKYHLSEVIAPLIFCKAEFMFFFLGIIGSLVVVIGNVFLIFLFPPLYTVELVLGFNK